MGVPAFYRWLSRKYRKIVVGAIERKPMVIDGVKVPLDLTQPNPNGEFDCFYIDMNGIIHPCSHPEDRPAPQTVEAMYANIMKYVDRLFAIARPRKLLFLAVDGVAPRAKMNQQRSRRYRASLDAEDRKNLKRKIIEELQKKGQYVTPNLVKNEWDSNVITPGTGFLYKCSLYIRYYILERMNSSPAWQNICVLFSDASEPGEGEHKIMNFIRSQRSLTNPGYDPNQKHCIHGLDADLIMLGLATHEPNFWIMREEVFSKKNGKKHKGKRGMKYAMNIDQQGMIIRNDDEVMSSLDLDEKSVEESLTFKPMLFLSLPILREYLYYEFCHLQQLIPPKPLNVDYQNNPDDFYFDFERIIDDFVFLCFFVGNDFLPHLPSLDIRDGALDYLILVYKQELPQLGGYLTEEGGKVHFNRIEVIFNRIGIISDEVFRRRKQAQEREDNKRKDIENRKKRGGSKQVMRDHAQEMASKGGMTALQGKRKRTEEEKYEDNKKAADILRSKLQNNTSSENEKIKSNETESIENKDDQPSKEEDDVENEEDKSIKAEDLKQLLKIEEQKRIDQYKEEIKDEIKLWEPGWKDRYYADKYKEEDITEGGGRERVYSTYAEGLQWVMYYYYQGCPSWSWFYPFHYSPFSSDLKEIARFEIKFDKGKPFTPLAQLMGVLPPSSSHALPKVCHSLMHNSSSPIIDFYPKDVKIDPNGKHLPWTWVTLLPFIDEERLIENLEERVLPHLSKLDQIKNQFHKPLLFIHKNHPNYSYFMEQYALLPEPQNMNNERKVDVWNNKIKIESQSVEFKDENGDDDLSDENESDKEESEDDEEDQEVEEEAEEGLALEINRFPFEVKIYKNNLNVTLDSRIKAPIKPVTAHFSDIQSNQVLVVSWDLPDHGKHLSQLLPGARLLPPVLSSSEYNPNYIVKLNRQMNIVDLARNNSPHGVPQVNLRYRSDMGSQRNQYYFHNNDQKWGSAAPKSKEDLLKTLQGNNQRQNYTSNQGFNFKDGGYNNNHNNNRYNNNYNNNNYNNNNYNNNNYNNNNYNSNYNTSYNNNNYNNPNFNPNYNSNNYNHNYNNNNYQQNQSYYQNPSYSTSNNYASSSYSGGQRSYSYSNPQPPNTAPPQQGNKRRKLG